MAFAHYAINCFISLSPHNLNLLFFCVLSYFDLTELIHICFLLKNFRFFLESSHYYFTPLRVFHTSISWWFFTGGWVTENLQKSPGLVIAFWPILTMLLFGWSRLILLFPNHPGPEPILWWLHLVCQLQLVSPSQQQVSSSLQNPSQYSGWS